MPDPKEESKKLQVEAKGILRQILGVPPVLITPEIDRLLECIIGAAVIESAIVVGEFMTGVFEASKLNRKGEQNE